MDLLDLLFTNWEGLVGGVVVRGCHGNSNHKMIEFSIIGEVRSGVRRTATLDIQRADFGLLKSLLNRVPSELVLKSRGVQEGQEGSLKGAGAGRTHVPKDKPVREKTSLAKQRALAGSQGKKESFPPLE